MAASQRKQAEFADQTPAQQRVAIALDAMGQLKRLDCQRSTGYVKTDAYNLKAIRKGDEPCTVCALGALFLSSVHLGNVFNEDLLRLDVHHDKTYYQLKRWFTISQLRQIERDGILDRQEAPLGQQPDGFCRKGFRDGSDGEWSMCGPLRGALTHCHDDVFPSFSSY